MNKIFFIIDKTAQQTLQSRFWVRQNALLTLLTTVFVLSSTRENSFSDEREKNIEREDIKIFYDNDVTFKWVTTPEHRQSRPWATREKRRYFNVVSCSFLVRLSHTHLSISHIFSLSTFRRSEYMLFDVFIIFHKTKKLTELGVGWIWWHIQFVDA